MLIIYVSARHTCIVAMALTMVVMTLDKPAQTYRCVQDIHP